MKRLFLSLSIVISLFVLGCELTPPDTAKYSIIYHGNGNIYGFPPTDNAQYASGAEATVLDKGTLEKTGYTFQSWNTNSQGTGTSYTSGVKIKINNYNVFLYAIWAEIAKFTVSFNSNDGSNVQSINNVYIGSKISKPANPTKTNHSFVGWFIDEELETAWNFESDTVTKDITLYAKWESTLIVYQYEISDVTHFQVGYNVVIYWVNPTDSNFSHVRIIPAGFEWAENMGGAGAATLDKEPGITMYSFLDYANTEYVTIKCVDKDGNVSAGIRYFLD